MGKSKNFWHSHHKWAYIAIAMKLFTTPGKVYRMAHGRCEVDSHKEHRIMAELQKRHIVHKSSHSHSEV